MFQSLMLRSRPAVAAKWLWSPKMLLRVQYEPTQLLKASSSPSLFCEVPAFFSYPKSPRAKVRHCVVRPYILYHDHHVLHCDRLCQHVSNEILSKAEMAGSWPRFRSSLSGAERSLHVGTAVAIFFANVAEVSNVPSIVHTTAESILPKMLPRC